MVGNVEHMGKWLIVLNIILISEFMFLTVHTEKIIKMKTLSKTIALLFFCNFISKDAASWPPPQVGPVQNVNINQEIRACNEECALMGKCCNTSNSQTIRDHRCTDQCGVPNYTQSAPKVTPPNFCPYGGRSRVGSVGGQRIEGSGSYAKPPKGKGGTCSWDLN